MFKQATNFWQFAREMLTLLIPTWLGYGLSLTLGAFDMFDAAWVVLYLSIAGILPGIAYGLFNCHRIGCRDFRGSWCGHEIVVQSRWFKDTLYINGEIVDIRHIVDLSVLILCFRRVSVCRLNGELQHLGRTVRVSVCTEFDQIDYTSKASGTADGEEFAVEGGLVVDQRVAQMAGRCV